MREVTVTNKEAAEMLHLTVSGLDSLYARGSYLVKRKIKDRRYYVLSSVEREMRRRGIKREEEGEAETEQIVEENPTYGITARLGRWLVCYGNRIIANCQTRSEAVEYHEMQRHRLPPMHLLYCGEPEL